MNITITLQQIIDLAEFAGVSISADDYDGGQLEVEYTVADCPPEGIKNDGEPSDPDSVSHYELIAYVTDYPDEGCIGLGPEIAP